MRKRIALQISRLIQKRAGTIAIVVLVMIVFSGWRVSKLTINHNQIELIPQHLQAVKSTKEMVDLVGGVGHLLLALKSDDLDHMKQVSDELAKELRQLPEVRNVTYKQDVEFVRDRLGLLIDYKDLKEAYRRIRKKTRSLIAKNNPFHIQLVETKDEPLDLSDLVDKYRKLNKKRVDDPYYIDSKNEMLMMIIKPMGNPNDLQFVRKLLASVGRTILEFNQTNALGARLEEGYVGLAKGATVTYGYTGTYKRNLDDSETMQEALVPTSLIALSGIFICLFLFIRKIVPILLLIFTLLASVLMTFAYCELVIGELNTITALLAAILMGLGIDFGIHLLYRLREEYTTTQDLTLALKTTLEHSGEAAVAHALTHVAGLYVLTLSSFRGFSDFGLVAGTGILITATMMYLLIPVIYVLADRVAPNFKNNLLLPEGNNLKTDSSPRPYPFARSILFGTLAITLGLGVFAKNVQFDYDSRSILAVNRPSIVLQEEIRDRYDISSDPVGIYTKTLAETKELYSKLTPIPEDSSIDSVASLFTVIPPLKEQLANKKILDKMHRTLSQLDPKLLTEDQTKKLPKLLKYLKAQPFSVEDLPQHISRQFVPVPEVKRDGYLTFIYPKTSLWDGRELIKFSDEVGEIQLTNRSVHSAGMAVLFAELAQIVLRDGTYLTALAALAVFLLTLLSFKSLKGATLAMIPLTAGMIWMLGLMAITLWKINFMNIVVFPVVLGYGISAGIHIYHRYVESGSALLAVKRTGAAVCASSITTLIGWGSLLISNHRGLESMGILACFGITSTLLVSLTILPAILEVWGRFRQPRNAGGKGALLSIVFLTLFNSGCSNVDWIYQKSGYNSKTPHAVKRINVAGWAPSEHPGLKRTLEAIATDYIKLKKSYLVLNQGPTTTVSWENACRGQDGVLFLRARDVLEDSHEDEISLQASAELYRCEDGALLWEALGGASVNTNDEQLLHLNSVYLRQLGATAAKYSSVVFVLLQDLLVTLPDVFLSDEELIEKIELD